MNVHVDRRSGAVTVTWHDARDAREVGDVLQSAGVDRHGRVRDRGFYEDGQAIWEAADDWIVKDARQTQSGPVSWATTERSMTP